MAVIYAFPTQHASRPLRAADRPSLSQYYAKPLIEAFCFAGLCMIILFAFLVAL